MCALLTPQKWCFLSYIFVVTFITKDTKGSFSRWLHTNVFLFHWKYLIDSRKESEIPNSWCNRSYKNSFRNKRVKKDAWNWTLPTIWNCTIFWFWQDLLKKQSCIPFLLNRLLALLPDKIKVTHRNLKQVSLNCQVFW